MHNVIRAGNEPFELRDDSVLPGDTRPKEEIKDSEAERDFLKQWREKRDKYRQQQLEKERANPNLIRTSSRVYVANSNGPSKGGKVLKGDMIKFEKVDIVSPEGKLLVKGKRILLRFLYLRIGL